MFGTFQREEEKPTYGITSPLQTWNPVMANIQPFIQLWKELKRIPGWVNKLRFIFAKPGWYPEIAGGVKAPPEVDSKTYRKFDIDVSPALNFYLFVQYLLILTATALFLFNLSDFTVGIQLLIAALIILSVASLGTLFQSKTQALKLESMRFVFTFLVFCFLAYANFLPLWLLVSVFAVSAISIAVLAKVPMHKMAPAD